MLVLNDLIVKLKDKNSFTLIEIEWFNLLIQESV
ncbi:hypothetical protein RHT_01360 [Candidatus Rhabdochlamydia sp. T3358]|nr:hypothetical protein RHT_01360 [Candidatus Rhabdochlamydia sp. T3358]